MYNIYKMPRGNWGAFVLGDISDGFETKEKALEWVCKKMEQYITKIEE